MHMILLYIAAQEAYINLSFEEFNQLTIHQIFN